MNWWILQFFSLSSDDSWHFRQKIIEWILKMRTRRSRLGYCYPLRTNWSSSISKISFIHSATINVEARILKKNNFLKHSEGLSALQRKVKLYFSIPLDFEQIRKEKETFPLLPLQKRSSILYSIWKGNFVVSTKNLRREVKRAHHKQTNCMRNMRESIDCNGDRNG